jgi:hypothetical protein
VTLREAPTGVVLAVVAAGLVLVAAHDWRLGSDVVGLGVVLAGALRLGLPERAAGMLAVRSRALDAGVLLVLGVAVVLLANSVPTP